MTTFDWDGLSHLQLGRYAEYLVKMEFTKLGCSVFSAEVDDRGIDFVLRSQKGRYSDVQVKSCRRLNYVFIPEEKLPEADNFYLALVLFLEKQPSLYLIPGGDLRKENDLFRYRRYGKPGQKSKPEFGLNLSKKNLDLLRPYLFSERATRLA